MADDPILKAIQGGGGVAVADEEEDDPILSAIRGPKPGTNLRTPTLNELATGQSPETQTTPLSTRAAKMGQPMTKLPPPQNPPFVDATKIPLNPFTNRYYDPSQTPQTVEEQQAAERAALAAETERTRKLNPAEIGASAQRGGPTTAEGIEEAQRAQDQFSTDLQSGSRKMPLPAFTEPGPTNPFPLGVRTSNVGELTDLASEFLNRPDIPKTRGEAFFAGATADTVKTLNDMFLSPIGLGVSALGLGETVALSKAGQFGGRAAKIAQEYEAMRAAGATGAELADVETKMKETIIAAAKAQKAATAGKVAGQAAAGGFAAQGGGNIVEGVKDKDASKVLEGLGQAALGGAAAVGAVRGGGAEKQVKAETFEAARKATEGQEVSAKRTPQVPERPQQPPQPAQLPGAPASVGAGEATVPEKPETLNAQVDALAKGTNKVVYFPKGTQTIPAPPEDANVTIVKGDKPGAGTYYHDDSVTPADIRKAVKNGTYGELLGNVQTKEAAAQGQPAAVVARDARGTEQKASVVDTSKPEAVQAQAQKLADQFPGAQIGIETPENVVAGRQASIPKPETSATETPLSAETRPVQGLPNASAESGASLEAISRTRNEKASGVQRVRIDTRTGKETPLIGPEAVDAKAGPYDRIVSRQANGTETTLNEGAKALPTKGQPASKAAEEVHPAVGVHDLGEIGTESTSSDEILRAMDQHELEQKVASIEARAVAGDQIPVAELTEGHALMDKMEAVNAEPVRESAAGKPVLAKGEKPTAEAAEKSEAVKAKPAENRVAEVATAPANTSTKPAEVARTAEGAASESVKFRKGDRVSYTNSKGQKLTGKIQSVDAGRGEAIVDVDQQAVMRIPGRSGVVPIGRIEFVPLSHLTNEEPERTIQPEKEPANVQAIESMGGRGEEAPRKVPAENGEPVVASRQAGRLGAERGEPSGRGVGAQHPERNTPVRGTEGGEVEPLPVAERGGPAAPGGEPAVQSRSGQSGNDYRITETDHIGEGSIQEKYRLNVAAIRVLKELEASGRNATPDEQAKLVRYSGWGWTGNLLNKNHDKWRNERAELKKLLTEEEYDSAVRSTTNAHYTSPEVVTAMWDAVSRLGFRAGRILEPSAGIGHFLGLMPDDIFAGSKKTAIELDQTSGKILRQLYQNADVRIQRFQELKGLNDFYDLAISNVPFGNYPVNDPTYKGKKYLTESIHNYFIARMLDKVRPGGLAAIITSHHSLDAYDNRARQAFLDHADLIGAIRLPGGAFQKNAGTEVTTDMLFFRKRGTGEKPGGQNFVATKEMELPGGEAQVNEYFHDHPSMALGEHTLEGTMYGHGQNYELKAGKEPLPGLLKGAIEKLPEQVMGEHEAPASVTRAATVESIPDWGDTKPWGYKVQDGRVFQNRDGQMVHRAEFPKANVEPLKQMLGIRDVTRELFQAEGNGRPGKDLTAIRGRLNRAYDAFVKKHGYLNQPKNYRIVAEDPDAPLLLALEKWNAKERTASKADVFFKQTIAPRKEVTSVDNVADALPASLAEKGKIDFDYMSKISGRPEDEIRTELRAAGLAFQAPQGHWETKDEYLSGDVRAKLRDAEEAAKLDKDFTQNVEALKQVQPRDLEPGEISVRLGTPWIPEEDIANFIDEAILGHQRYGNRTTVRHIASEAIWKLENGQARYNEAAQTKWGTARMRPLEIIEGALNLKRPTVYDEAADGKRSVNEKETLAAREKLEQIEEEFSKWMFKDPDRAERLTKWYNENRNNIVDRNYDGSHLTLPGKSAGITMRPHQMNAIWRSVVGGNTLLAHVVGAGKTYTIIGSAMEKRRLGLAKKPMIVVPNHLVEQWGADFLRLYPQARILAASKEDFEAKNRKTIMSRIATGDWDAVIVPHASFGLLPVSIETLQRYAQKQLDMLEDHIRELKDERGQSNRRTVKELEKAKERIKVRMERAANRERKDNTINFEDTGVDALYVDEAHMYKNLFFSTKMGNINGIPKSDAQRAFDMYLKTKYISDLNNGANVAFATGTPISNTMAEIYTMMRYLDEGRLEAGNLSHFDSWAAAFGNTVQNMEVSPEDPTKFRVSTRFAKFMNVPELKRMFRQTADVIHPEDLEGIVKVPDVEGGKAKVIEVPASQRVLDYIQTLGERAKAIRRKEVDPTEDNMLKITSEGRKVALDYRSMVPGANDDGESKIAAAAKKVADIYHETRSTKRAQAVMLDLMTPSDAGKKRGQFNAYADLKNKLVGMGVPADQVAFIHDAKSDAAKQALFDAVNSGEKAVIIGSSDKMGVGTNIQERLLALHHVDAPWRPSDIEQREGRIIRQGNTNPTVQIYRYVTQGTFDAYMWSTIARKASFIKEMMQHGYDQRELEDVDGATLSYAEAAAIATGDKRVLEKVQTDADVDRLQKLKQIHEQSAITNRIRLAQIPERISGTEASRDAILQDIKTRDANKREEFQMTVGKKTYTDRKDAGAALNAAVEANRGSGRMKVGTFQGFDIEADGSGNPYLYGKSSHGFTVNHESPIGTIQSAERNIGNLETYAANREEDIKALRRDLEARKAELEKPFNKQAQLNKLLAKQKELNEALVVNKEDKTMAGAREGQEFDDNFKEIAPSHVVPGEGEGLSEIPRRIVNPENPEAGFGFNPLIELGHLIYRAFRALRGKRVPASGEPIPVGARVESSGVPRTAPDKRPVEHAGNIRLDKLNAPEDVLNEIRRAAKENAPEFNEQRRGSIPFNETRDMAKKLVEEGMFTEKDLKSMKAGTALNAEELQAARSMLIASAQKVREAAAKVRTNGNVDNVLAFQEALLRHDGIQKAVSGAVAEAGRALSQQRMVAKALEGKDQTAHERVLEALGGKELSEDAARRLAEIPEDDSVALNNFLRSQKHWTTAQKIEAYWIANVLSSPRTPIKKVLGDVSLGIVETARRFVDVPVDKIMAAIQGRKSETTLREALVAPLSYLSALPEGIRKASYIIMHGFDTGDPLTFELPRRYEFPGGIKNPLNVPGRALSAATKFFQVLAFQGEMHAQAVRQAASEGLKGEGLKNRAAELIQHPTEDMIDAAMKAGEFQTFTERPDVLSRILMSMRDKVALPKGIPLIGGLHPLRFVIPFVQIPYNLTKHSLRYSPFGFARLNDFEHAKSPEATKTISRALIGTAIVGLFAYFAAKKMLTGAAPNDPAGRDEFYRSGKQPYSIKIGNRWVSYKAAGPFALTAAAVAAWHDRNEKKNDMPATDQILAFGGAMGRALADESFLRGLKGGLDAMQDPERFSGRLVSSWLGGFVPMESALRTLGDALDPTVRNPQTMYERIAAGLPVLSKTVAPKLDTLGRPSTKEGSSGFAALFPGGFSKDEPKSAIDAELDRLNKLGLKNVGFAGKHLVVEGYKVALSIDEQDRYQKLRGAYLQSYLRQTFNAPEYKQMSDEDKIQASEDAIHQAERDARAQIGDQILAERLKKVRSAAIPRRPPGAAMTATP